MMRILAVQETDWVERNPILHHRMMESLTLAGDEVTVLDFEVDWRKNAPLWRIRRGFNRVDVHKFFPDSHVRVIRPSMLAMPGIGRATWLASSSIHMRRIFGEWRPDVVVGYGISNAYVGLSLARRNRSRFVYHLLDALHTLVEPSYARLVPRLVERRVMRGADHVVAVNNRLGQYAIEMGADPGRVDVIPMGTSVQTPEPELRRQVREALGFGPEDVVLLFMGHLYDFAGLAQVAEHVASAPSWLKLLIVGEGPARADIEAVVRRHQLDKRVTLTGRRPRTDMAGFLEAADVGLLPSEKNATMRHIVPAKVLEYMEHGKAVVATRLPGLQAEFGDLPGVMYVDESGQAVEKVLAVASAPEEIHACLTELGETCRQFMQRRQDWDAVTRRFRDILVGLGSPASTRIAGTSNERPSVSSKSHETRIEAGRRR